MRISAFGSKFERFIPSSNGIIEIAIVIVANTEVEESGRVAFDLQTTLIGNFGLFEVTSFEVGRAFFEESLGFFVSRIERGRSGSGGGGVCAS